MILPVAPFSANVKPAIRFQKSNEFLNFHLAESTSPILAPHNVPAQARAARGGGTDASR